MKTESKILMNNSIDNFTHFYKSSLKQFLSSNPFSSPWTLGFFYREKMRAIYNVSPDLPYRKVLEIGGGRGGLTALLYPKSHITNVDIDPQFSRSPSNQTQNVTFICCDATQLPFDDSSFDAVTMFDVLEHIQNDEKAVLEALRVLRSGGKLLISTPNENWKFPYYNFMKSVCPSDDEVMAEWGHVRRGYTIEDLEQLMDLPCEKFFTFITPITVVGHDVAFSRLPYLIRQLLSIMISPMTWIGYLSHKPHSTGTETASAWEKP